MFSRYLLQFKSLMSVALISKLMGNDVISKPHILKFRVESNVARGSPLLKCHVCIQNPVLILFVNKIRKRGHTDGQLRYQVGREPRCVLACCRLAAYRFLFNYGLYLVRH